MLLAFHYPKTLFQFKLFIITNCGSRQSFYYFPPHFFCIKVQYLNYNSCKFRVKFHNLVYLFESTSKLYIYYAFLNMLLKIIWIINDENCLGYSSFFFYFFSLVQRHDNNFINDSNYIFECCR